MDNFTEGRINRAKDVVSKLCSISGVLVDAYKGVTPDGEYKYDAKSFFLEANAGSTISNAIAMIEELIELWEKEAEDKKTESRALDILKRIQTEYPIHYKNVNSIEVTPSSEKLTFWYPDRDEFKDPEPEIMKNKTDSRDVPSLLSDVALLEDLIDDFDKFGKASLEKDDNGTVIISYSEPKKGDSEVRSSKYSLSYFLESLKLKAEEDTK